MAGRLHAAVDGRIGETNPISPPDDSDNVHQSSPPTRGDAGLHVGSLHLREGLDERAPI